MRGVIGQRSQPIDQAGGDVRGIKKRIELRQHEHTIGLMTLTNSGMSGIERSGYDDVTDRARQPVDR
jgi:hypothetical protein